jgi:hypothetical protein
MTDEPNDMEVKPGVTFYFYGAGNDDDTIDVTSEGITPLPTLARAVDYATELTRDHGGAHFVIECKVVARVSRGRIRVTKYGSRK